MLDVRNISSDQNTTKFASLPNPLTTFVDNQDYLIVSLNTSSHRNILSHKSDTARRSKDTPEQMTNNLKPMTYVIPITSMHIDTALQNISSSDRNINCDPNITNSSEENVEENVENIFEPETNNFQPNNQSVADDIADNDTLPFCKDINEKLKYLRKMGKEIILTDKDLCLLDLMEIMSASNCPRGMFDKITLWVDKHKDTISVSTLTKREETVNSWFEKLYGTDFKSDNRIPVKQQITLSSGRKANMTKLSLENAFIDMITSPNFVPENLNIDPEDPRCPKQQDDLFYREPNTGNWGRDRLDELKNDLSTVYAPLTFFTDGLKIDKYGKHSIEAVLGCFLWYNHEQRQREENW